MHTFSSPVYSNSPFFITCQWFNLNWIQIKMPQHPRILKVWKHIWSILFLTNERFSPSPLAALTLNCWLTCSIETAVCFIASRPPSFSPGLKTLSSEILRAPPIGLWANLKHHRVNNKKKTQKIRNRKQN